MLRRLILPLILAGATILAAAPVQAKCEKDRCWGSIAFSRLSGYWVYSMNHGNAKAARSRAWKLCNKRCTNVATVRNGCLAFVLAPRGRYATAEGRTAETATENALRKCQRRHKDCRVRIARCTADFDEIKRRAKEKAAGRPRAKSKGRPTAPTRKTPPANVEELKL